MPRPKPLNSPCWRLMLHVAGVVAGRRWRADMKDWTDNNGSLRGVYDRDSDIRAAGIEQNLRRYVLDAMKRQDREYLARRAALKGLLDVIDRAQHDREYLRGRDARGPDAEVEALFDEFYRQHGSTLKHYKEPA